MYQCTRTQQKAPDNSEVYRSLWRVGVHFGISFMSLFWRQEFRGGYKTSKILWIPALDTENVN